MPSGKNPASVRSSGSHTHLRDLVLREVTTQVQCDLLLETEVHARMTQKEWAKAHGVKHSAVRTRRHRAVQAIRTYEAERKRREQEALD